MNVVYPPTISFNLLYQRPQYVLRKFAELGYTPIFYDSNPPYEGAEHCEHPYIEDGIRVVPPDTSPFMFSPFHLYYSVSNHYPWTIYNGIEGATYDLLDYPTEGQSFSLLEQALKDADNVFVVSDFLMEIAETYTKGTATYIPNGVDYELFSRPFKYCNSLSRIIPLDEESSQINEASFKENGRTIGYSGVVWSEIWDHDLFLKICNEFSEDTILMTGSMFNDYGKLPSNVKFAGHVPRESLPNFMSVFDVAIIPFLQNNFTKAMCPLKYLEYCAVGKPVVSTPIPEVEKGPCSIGACHEDFIEKIHKELETKQHPTKIAARKKYAEMNSWSNVLKPMDEIFGVK